MKEQILQAAAALFLQNGIRVITMDDIAAAMGISKKTVYLHFANKNEIVHTAFADMADATRVQLETVAAAAVHPIQERLDYQVILDRFQDRLNGRHIRDLAHYYPDAYQVLIDFRDEFLYRQFAGNMKWGMAEMLYRTDLQPAVMSRYQLSILFPLEEHNRAFCKSFNCLYTGSTMIYYCLHGIVTEKGRHYLEKHTKKPALPP